MWLLAQWSKSVPTVKCRDNYIFGCSEAFSNKTLYGDWLCFHYCDQIFWIMFANRLDNEFEGGEMEKWGSFRNSMYGNLQ